MRSASLTDGVLSLRGDFNRSTALDLMRNVDTVSVEIMGVPKSATSLLINNIPTSIQTLPDGGGNWLARVDYEPPAIPIPDLSALDWRYLDALPEVQPTFSDRAWPNADHTTTNNTYLQAPLTPTSLYASDYTFHSGGALIFRGRKYQHKPTSSPHQTKERQLTPPTDFTATGHETTLTLQTQGGRAFAALVFLNATHLGSWPGNATGSSHRATYPVRLVPGAAYVLTVVVDNMGYAQNGLVGGDDMKAPRGILEYGFGVAGGEAPAVAWKVTGNLGGEGYVDKARGPLNEGGLWVERMGFHLPGVPAGRLGGGAKGKGSPMEGVGEPGVGFWTAEMRLDIPGETWDVPLSFEFPGIDAAGGSGRYRAVLWVNGFRECVPFLFAYPLTYRRCLSWMSRHKCPASRDIARCIDRVPASPHLAARRDRSSVFPAVLPSTDMLTPGRRIRPLHQPHRPADVVSGARGHPQLPRDQHHRRRRLGDAARRRQDIAAHAQGRDARADGPETGRQRRGAGVDREARGVLVSSTPSGNS
jgi:hypothetical protein